MTLFKHWLFTMLVILLCFAPFSRVDSQTDEPLPDPTPEATVVVISPDTTAPDTVGDLDQVLKIVLAIIGAFFSGSLLTIGGIVLLIRTLRKDPEKMAMIERLYDSRPDEARARIRGGVEVAKEIVAAADEATDGVPLRDKKEPVG